MIAAVLVGLVAVGRAASPEQGPAPMPRPSSQSRRGSARPSPWFVLFVLLAVLAMSAVVVGPDIVFVGTMWLACRGGGAC